MGPLEGQNTQKDLYFLVLKNTKTPSSYLTHNSQVHPTNFPLHFFLTLPLFTSQIPTLSSLTTHKKNTDGI